MSRRSFFKDLGEVAGGVRDDVIDVVNGVASNEDAGVLGNDLTDLAKTMTGDVTADTVGLYGKGVEFAKARHERLKTEFEGATAHGRDTARRAMEEFSSGGGLTDGKLRGLSDATSRGRPQPADMNADYEEGYRVGKFMIREENLPSAFPEVRDRRHAVAEGVRAEIRSKCRAVWGHDTAQEARYAGVLQPLIPPAPTGTSGGAGTGTHASSGSSAVEQLRAALVAIADDVVARSEGLAGTVEEMGDRLQVIHELLDESGQEGRNLTDLVMNARDATQAAVDALVEAAEESRREADRL